VAAKQARDFHNAEARLLWKSKLLQHLCCSDYILVRLADSFGEPDERAHPLVSRNSIGNCH
jgi:hypothetical protein